MENNYKNLVLGCQNCKHDFIIEPDDFLFYEKIKVPPPTFCPECRLIRRLVFRNERSLYKRNCDLCGKEKILIYSKGSHYKVYCYDCFFSEGWNPLSYGIDYDFSKTFFDQYKELSDNFPKLGIVRQGLNVNGEYTNRVSDSKNCYLIFGSNKNENCYYGVSFWDSKDSIDCYNLRKSEKCTECIDCYNCNSLKYSKECNGCLDSWFLTNCRNCQNCFGCFNLRNKNYFIYNEQYTKEEYFNKIKELELTNRDNLQNLKEKVQKESIKYIFPSIVEHHAIDVSGNWIENSKNIKSAFNCDNVENGKYLFGITDAKDIMDYTYWGRASELMYEINSVGRQCSSVFFASECWEQLLNSEYCINCFSSANLFGCIGLKKKQYCILNKQYTKEEYEILIPKIKQHMIDMPFIDKAGRVIKYGEFFPCDMTPFAYNETIAQEYFPKTKEQAVKEGYRWIDVDKKSYVPTIMGVDLEKDISKVRDDIINEVIGCIHQGDCNHQCTVAFKIIPDELQFYRANNIPIPTLCPNCRHYERLSIRNPIKLWHRKCMNEGCPNEFETSYAPDRPEIVYCEKCYQQEVN
ncbi:MAG: hypothetical protein WDK96_03765 [Candidatus Paceibacterota bacterium]|jgi:hypothetical protein